MCPKVKEKSMKRIPYLPFLQYYEREPRGPLTDRTSLLTLEEIKKEIEDVVGEKYSSEKFENYLEEVVEIGLCEQVETLDGTRYRPTGMGIDEFLDKVEE